MATSLVERLTAAFEAAQANPAPAPPGQGPVFPEFAGAAMFPPPQAFAAPPGAYPPPPGPVPMEGFPAPNPALFGPTGY